MTPIVLLIEDNPDHVLLIQAALEAAALRVSTTVLSDGAQALDYIGSVAAESALNVPGVIVLDLKLPRVGGLEVLRALRASPAWQGVPVIVLTTSSHPDDVQACLSAGANFYLSKMLGLDGLMMDLAYAVQISLGQGGAPRSQAAPIGTSAAA
jgi:two-component system response regulator